MDDRSSAPKFDSSRGDGSVQTKSHMKKLWLTKLRGYRVSSISRKPKAGLFGKISYSRVWTLKKKR